MCVCSHAASSLPPSGETSIRVLQVVAAELNSEGSKDVVVYKACTRS